MGVRLGAGVSDLQVGGDLRLGRPLLDQVLEPRVGHLDARLGRVDGTELRSGGYEAVAVAAQQHARTSVAVAVRGREAATEEAGRAAGATAAGRAEVVEEAEVRVVAMGGGDGGGEGRGGEGGGKGEGRN